MGWPEAELSLTLINDRAMARLNRETFGRRGPTNVISFPVDVEQAPSPVLLQPGAAVPHPPPLLGEHNDYVFGEILGLAPAEIAGLKSARVIY